MKFNYKNRGFVVISLSMMLIALGVVNYKLSKESALSVSDQFKAYEEAQVDKNSTDSDKKEVLVDSVDNDKNSDKSTKKEGAKVSTKAKDDVESLEKETSKQIESALNSKENINESTYIVDMKMSREKQRNDLIEKLNEIINNPSTSDDSKVEASNMKMDMVKNSDLELQIENLLLAKGYDEAIVYINNDKANVVVNMKEITQQDANKIFELIKSQANIKYENIKLTNNR